MDKRENRIGIRLTDQHLERLEEYCSVTGATPTGVINTLAESYIQAMIERGAFISPKVENLNCKELLLVAEEPAKYHAKKVQQAG
jgi:hypothetical protein